MALEWGRTGNHAAVSQYRFSLWSNQALTALTALTWSKTNKHIFLGKEEKKRTLFVSPKLTSETDPDPWVISSLSMRLGEDKWVRLFLALLRWPFLILSFLLQVEVVVQFWNLSVRKLLTKHTKQKDFCACKYCTLLYLPQLQIYVWMLYVLRLVTTYSKRILICKVQHYLPNFLYKVCCKRKQKLRLD